MFLSADPGSFTEISFSVPAISFSDSEIGCKYSRFFRCVISGASSAVGVDAPG